jgi:hypothetical protein
MKHIKHIVLLLSIMFILFSTISSAYTPSDTDIAPEENVITASDAGGGNITTGEVVLIILAMVGVLFLIAAIAVSIFH